MDPKELEKRMAREGVRALTLTEDDLFKLSDIALVNTVHSHLRSAPAASALPLRARYFLAVSRVDTEVCNGGFDQLCWNGVTFAELELAREGFSAIGSERAARVVSDALAYLRGKYGSDDEVAQGRLKEERLAAESGPAVGFGDVAFEALDAAYYRAYWAERPGTMARSFQALLAAYVRRFSEDFCAPLPPR